MDERAWACFTKLKGLTVEEGGLTSGGLERPRGESRLGNQTHCSRAEVVEGLLRVCGSKIMKTGCIREEEELRKLKELSGALVGEVLRHILRGLKMLG